MAYSRGQQVNFVGTVDSRDGYDHATNRTQNEIYPALIRQPVNIPVRNVSGSWYASATYPGIRGGSDTIPVDRDSRGKQQTSNVISPQSEPVSAKSYLSSVSTQLGNTAQVPLYAGSRNVGADPALTQNSTGPYIAAMSSLPNRKRMDGSVALPESYPVPVSSQIVYTSRVPGGPAGKVAVASSRRATYQPGVAGDAAQPQLRQIPIVVVPSQATSPDGSREPQDQRVFRQTKSYQEPNPSQSRSPASRSRSFGPNYSKEAEVDALTDLLVQNMNVAGSPDFCGMCVKCGRSVMGEKSSCVALDQLFHVDCFRCKACNNCLSGQPFYAMEGQPYCELCYMQTLEKCSVCSKPIVDRMLRATGKPYHPTCFTCVVCGKNLDGLVFTVDATNQVHCIEDFHRKFAPRCSVCSRPIMPSNAGDKEAVRIVVLDRNFHIECFRCEDCGMVMTADSDSRGCYPHDDFILCKMCNARRIQILTGKSTTDL